MTKREAAGHLQYLLKLMRERIGDEDIDVWRLHVAWIAGKLDPSKTRQLDEEIAFSPEMSRQTKLRALIEHPSTPAAEREAAVAALSRIREAA